MAKTIEEKAKAYDEAINKMKTQVAAGLINQDVSEYVFPELKESEDEKIRKELIDFLRFINKNGFVDDFSELNYTLWIAWLEKQGEQEWSVNDENTMKYLQFIVDFFDTNPGTKEGLKKWLESLKDRIIPQKQWKPTKAQLDALEFVIEGNIISNIYVLKDLLNKLKTL